MQTLPKHVQVSLMPLGTFRGTGHILGLSLPGINFFPFMGRATDINESLVFVLYLHHT